MPPRANSSVARKIFLIATEESGDRLGANLMKVLRQRLGGAVQFEGVGGQSTAREGLVSLFPIEELSIMGLAAVVRQLPMILRRIRETADAVTQAFAPRGAPRQPNAVLAEAGTGVGKTLGYIAPASLWAEKNEGAVWINLDLYLRTVGSPIVPQHRKST